LYDSNEIVRKNNLLIKAYMKALKMIFEFIFGLLLPVKNAQIVASQSVNNTNYFCRDGICNKEISSYRDNSTINRVKGVCAC